MLKCLFGNPESFLKASLDQSQGDSDIFILKITMRTSGGKLEEKSQILRCSLKLPCIEISCRRHRYCYLRRTQGNFKPRKIQGTFLVTVLRGKTVEGISRKYQVKDVSRERENG